MSVKRTKQGYQVDLRDTDGRRHRKTFRTQKAADAYERQMIDQREQGITPERGNGTLSHAIPEWEAAHYPGIRQNTTRGYKGAIPQAHPPGSWRREAPQTRPAHHPTMGERTRRAGLRRGGPSNTSSRSCRRSSSWRRRMACVSRCSAPARCRPLPARCTGLHRPYDAASLRIVDRTANWYSTVRASNPFSTSPFTHCWMVRWSSLRSFASPRPGRMCLRIAPL